MLLTLLLTTVAMLATLGTALYLAYMETEADFPLRQQTHRH
jgi:ABC-type sulfate transport system permease component